jgi:hypothetical protein
MYLSIFEKIKWINFIIKAKEIEGIKILRYEESIYFANCENFIYKIIKFSGVNPNEIISKIKKKKNSYEKKMKSKEKNGNTLSEVQSIWFKKN